MPQNTSLTLVPDVDVYSEMPEGVIVETYGSYRAVREMLLQFERGVSINELASDDSYIFIMRVERLVLNGGDTFNLVRTSGKHAMITPIHYILDKA